MPWPRSCRQRFGVAPRRPGRDHDAQPARVGGRFVAAASIGAVPAPVNSFGLRDELLAVLRDVAPRVLVCDADRLARVAGDLAQLDCMAVVVDGEPPPARRVRSLPRRAVAAGGARRAPVRLEPDDPALILFTSGATSQAKGVLSSQRAVCQALCNIDYIGAVAALELAAAAGGDDAARLRAGHADGACRCSTSAACTRNCCRPCAMAGASSSCTAGIRRARIELIRAEGITQFNGAPSMVMQLMAEAGFDDAAATRSLGGLGFGGAGLPQRAIDELLRRKPDSMSGVGFGLTESNGVATAASGDLFAYKPHSSGVVSPIIALRVADEDGAALPARAAGRSVAARRDA